MVGVTPNEGYRAFKHLGDQLNREEYDNAVIALKKYNSVIRVSPGDSDAAISSRIFYMSSLDRTTRYDLYHLFDYAKQYVREAIKLNDLDITDEAADNIVATLATDWPATIELVDKDLFKDHPEEYDIKYYSLLDDQLWLEREVAKEQDRLEIGRR